MLCLVSIGVPDERFELFAAAAVRCGLKAPTLLSYADALNNVERHLTEKTVVRFESTDEDRAALRCYLTRGRQSEHDLTEDQSLNYEPEVGAIAHMPQAYRGRCRTWSELEDRISACGARTMNSATGLAVTFDKRITASVLNEADVPVPPFFHSVTTFKEVADIIHEVPRKQLMIKTAHGAGATGAVAVRTDGKRWHASTTAMLRDGQLWNTRQSRTITDPQKICELVDTISAQNIQVEHWLPKATMKAIPFDVRVVVINGVARHVLMRCAPGPFTNLHLGAVRGDVAQLRTRLGDKGWSRMKALAESAVQAITERGSMLYAGVDILIASDWLGMYVLEVNGFGDWHPDVFIEGLDTYDWEMRALLENHAARETQ